MMTFNASAAFAASGDLFLNNTNLYFSNDYVIHGQTVRIYATVGNNSQNDLLGSVQFHDQTTGSQIGTDQAVSVLAGGEDTVFVDWIATGGNHTITGSIYPWDASADDTSNNSAAREAVVDYDFDSDGLGNAVDPDDDNDGTPDTEDTFPYDPEESADTDNDGAGDNADEDDDNDGTPDVEDALPKDENEVADNDEDGIGDNADEDDDNDGLSDDFEIATTNPETGETKETTNPVNSDTDADGVNDSNDVFPNDPTESADNDNDGTGDNADQDDDNDNVIDSEDEVPNNPGPVIVYEQREEVDPITGDTYVVFDASQSFDPDGEVSQVTYEWLDEEGRLIGEEAVLRLLLGNNSLYPASLKLIDDEGESRNLNVNVQEFGALWLLLTILGLAGLAIVIYLKYTATASRKKPKKHGKKGQRSSAHSKEKKPKAPPKKTN